MTTVRDLLVTNLHDVFGNRDRDARRSAVDAILAEDVSFTDPDGRVVGRDAVEAKAAALLDAAPEEFVLSEAGPAYVDGDFGVLPWQFGPADGEPVARGVDMITIVDGRIATLRTLLAEG